MPSLITHDFFGRDIYDNLYNLIGGSRDEADAFLLGNQGPDPLFYAVINPALRTYKRLGTIMHDQKPAELFVALKNSLSILSDAELPIGHAYALGFLCHYTLDCLMHPYIFFHEYRLCDAGEPNLSRADASEVHGVIESELDELVLFKKREETIATFNPATEILKADNFVLHTVSKMFAYVTLTVYGDVVPADMFMHAIKDFRLVQHVFHSPHGIKRALAGRIERMARPHSLFQSMSHRPVELTESIFDNAQHKPWENPFTGKISTMSFWDLYSKAQTKARDNIIMFDQEKFDMAAAHNMTGDLNFSGDITVATVMSVKNLPEKQQK